MNEEKREYDLKERTFIFAQRILNIAEELPSGVVCDVIKRQIVKSGTSVGANVEEADGSRTKPDSANKFVISRREARETRYWLRLIKGKYLSGKSVDEAINEAGELIKIFTSIINKLSA